MAVRNTTELHCVVTRSTGLFFFGRIRRHKLDKITGEQ